METYIVACRIERHDLTRLLGMDPGAPADVWVELLESEGACIIGQSGMAASLHLQIDYHCSDLKKAAGAVSPSSSRDDDTIAIC